MTHRAGPEWSQPFHGVSHYKRLGQGVVDGLWCTVTDRQTFAELSIYEGAGSGFCSRCGESRREHNHWEEFTFADVESARKNQTE